MLDCTIFLAVLPLKILRFKTRCKPSCGELCRVKSLCNEVVVVIVDAVLDATEDVLDATEDVFDATEDVLDAVVAVVGVVVGVVDVIVVFVVVVVDVADGPVVVRIDEDEMDDDTLERSVV